MSVNNVATPRLELIPASYLLITSIMMGDLGEIRRLGLQLGIGWPDHDFLNILPEVAERLSKVGEPTGFETWLIVKRDGMNIIGDIGFKAQPDLEGAVDIGYSVIEMERRMGYGLEAATGLVEWVFSQPLVRVVTAKCLINNTGSARLLQKLGMTEVGRDSEMIHWKLTRPVP